MLHYSLNVRPMLWMIWGLVISSRTRSHPKCLFLMLCKQHHLYVESVPRLRSSPSTVSHRVLDLCARVLVFVHPPKKGSRSPPPHWHDSHSEYHLPSSRSAANTLRSVTPCHTDRRKLLEPELCEKIRGWLTSFCLRIFGHLMNISNSFCLFY